jgi:hypothetical protein
MWRQYERNEIKDFGVKILKDRPHRRPRRRSEDNNEVDR